MKVCFCLRALFTTVGKHALTMKFADSHWTTSPRKLLQRPEDRRTLQLKAIDAGIKSFLAVAPPPERFPVKERRTTTSSVDVTFEGRASAYHGASRGLVPQPPASETTLGPCRNSNPGPMQVPHNATTLRKLFLLQKVTTGLNYVHRGSPKRYLSLHFDLSFLRVATRQSNYTIRRNSMKG